jgi:hypothetical protein
VWRKEAFVSPRHPSVAGVGGFSTDNYWSSSEYDGGSAWVQDFSVGLQDFDFKGFTYYVRPVRAF